MDGGITDSRTRPRHRHSRRRRRLPVIVSGLALVAVLSGCGSGPGNDTTGSSFTPAPLTTSSPDSSASSPDPDSQEGQESTEASNQPNGSGGLTPIGTITQTWTGATAVTSYSIGTPTFGDSSPLPDGVAGACQLTDPALLDSAAYFPISMTISFTSQVATDVLIQPDGALANDTTPLNVGGAYIAYMDNTAGSHWSCDDSTQTYTLGPNTGLAITTWVIVPGLITNQNPHPTIASFTAWNLSAPASILMTNDPTVQASGPHAATCNNDDPPRTIVSLFNTPPYHYQGQDSLGPTGAIVTCTPA
jgi:hypothetical protein